MTDEQQERAKDLLDQVLMYFEDQGHWGNDCELLRDDLFEFIGELEKPIPETELEGMWKKYIKHTTSILQPKHRDSQHNEA